MGAGPFRACSGTFGARAGRFELPRAEGNRILGHRTSRSVGRIRSHRGALSKPVDAVRIAGLLADSDRRAVFAAVVLGAVTLDDVVARSGTGPRAAASALARLVSAGLIVQGSDGSLALVSGAFADAAREAAPPAAAPRDERERTIGTFVRDGRLESMPTQRSKRLVILDLIVQDFEPGRKYTEDEVSAIAARWDDDYAAIRRWLVDEELLTREAGTYWRSGGRVDVD